MKAWTPMGAWCALIMLSGCGALPDAKPFADATGVLSASVRAGGSAVADSLREAGEVAPEGRDEYAKLARDFNAAWRDRVDSARATGDYADAIATLISAGNDGAETVNKVADALASLATAVNIPVATPAASAVVDATAFVAKQVALVRASGTLASAMAQAQPAVDRLANLFVQDAEQRLKPLLRDLNKNTVSGIKSAYEFEDSYHIEIQKRRKRALSEMLTDTAKLAKAQDLDRADQEVAVALQERDRKLADAAAAYKARLQLIDAFSNATISWAQAHRDLAAAVRDKRKVNVAELQAAVAELRVLVKKVRDL